MAGPHHQGPELADAERRKALGQAIGDIQGSIHANDSKSAAGLVVHGLLATAVLTLASRLGHVYGDANGTAQWLIRWTLIWALVFAVASIACLLIAIIPYDPTEVTKRMYERSEAHYGKVFFPDIVRLKDIARFGNSGRGVRGWLRRTGENWRYGLRRRRALRGNDEFVQLKKIVAEVNCPEKLEAEYIAELVEVADIREHEARWARRGFWLLLAEVVMVAGYLGTVGAVSGHLLGASG
jgi:hypothetical protein